MKQKRAEELADEIIRTHDSMRTPDWKVAIYKHLCAIVECNGCPSIGEALNSGDGTYKP